MYLTQPIPIPERDERRSTVMYDSLMSLTRPSKPSKQNSTRRKPASKRSSTIHPAKRSSSKSRKSTKKYSGKRKKSRSMVQSKVSLYSDAFDPSRTPSRSSLKSGSGLLMTSQSRISFVGLDDRKESSKNSKLYRSSLFKSASAVKRAKGLSARRLQAWRKRYKHIEIVDGNVVTKSFGDVIRSISPPTTDLKRDSAPLWGAEQLGVDSIIK